MDELWFICMNDELCFYFAYKYVWKLVGILSSGIYVSTSLKCKNVKTDRHSFCFKVCCPGPNAKIHFVVVVDILFQNACIPWVNIDCYQGFPNEIVLLNLFTGCTSRVSWMNLDVHQCLVSLMCVFVHTSYLQGGY